MSSQPAGFPVVVAGEASESEESDGEVAAILEGGPGRGGIEKVSRSFNPLSTAKTSSAAQSHLRAILLASLTEKITPTPNKSAKEAYNGHDRSRGLKTGTSMGTEVLPTDKQQQPTTAEATAEGGGQSQVGKSEIEKIPPKYNTLLHKKLDERNRSLKKNIREFLSVSYHHGNRTIHTSTEHLIKSKAALQDVTHNLSVIQRDLVSLQEKVDIISTCNLLPQLTVAPRHTATPSS
ncbi:biogenesis of lysosome- organelles complex 1 subunit 3 [Branchiostoma belcheri]|nr:biogenesis of lysosome- organelles complex 1 subunit 3 [Branchiostoma belcheri]